MRAGELTLQPPNDNGGIECPSRSSIGERSLVVWTKESGMLSITATPQAQIQRSELTHPNIYILCEGASLDDLHAGSP